MSSKGTFFELIRNYFVISVFLCKVPVGVRVLIKLQEKRNQRFEKRSVGRTLMARSNRRETKKKTLNTERVGVNRLEGGSDGEELASNRTSTGKEALKERPLLVHGKEETTAVSSTSTSTLKLSLPLNSKIVERIRLNINSSLPPTGRKGDAESEDEEEMPLKQQKDNLLIPLQDALRKKMSKALQPAEKERERLDPSEGKDSLSEIWLSLDSVYRDLTKTMRRSKKESTVTLSADLWDQMDARLSDFRCQYKKQTQPKEVPSQVKRKESLSTRCPPSKKKSKS